MHHLVQLADGTVSLAIHLPIQAFRTWQLLSPDDKARAIEAVKRRVGVGLGAFKEDSLSRAMPFIAIGIVGVVAYNIWKAR
jgi:hypothetical protein